MKNIENLKNRKVAFSAGLRLLNDVQNGGATDQSNNGIPDQSNNGIPDQSNNGIPDQSNNGIPNQSNNGIPDNIKLLRDYLIVLDELDNILTGELLNKVVYEVLSSLYNADVNEVIKRHKENLVKTGGSLPLNPSYYNKEQRIVERTASILGINQYNQNIQITNSSSIKKNLRNIL